MTGRSLSEWADIVAEVANRREAEWQERLRRPVEYGRDVLRLVAGKAHTIGSVLGDEAGLGTAEEGFLLWETECGWQQEWNLRNRVVAGHG